MIQQPPQIAQPDWPGRPAPLGALSPDGEGSFERIPPDVERRRYGGLLAVTSLLWLVMLPLSLVAVALFWIGAMAGMGVTIEGEGGEQAGLIASALLGGSLLVTIIAILLILTCLIIDVVLVVRSIRRIARGRWALASLQLITTFCATPMVLYLVLHNMVLPALAWHLRPLPDSLDADLLSLLAMLAVCALVVGVLLRIVQLFAGLVERSRARGSLRYMPYAPVGGAGSARLSTPGHAT